MGIEPLNAAMDCTEVERTVDVWLDSELEDRDRAELERHLQKCPRCQSLADVRTRVRAASVKPLAEVTAASMANGGNAVNEVP